MDTIKIGQLEVLRIGLGTNRIRNNQPSMAALIKAVDLGINFFDTASAYSSGESEEVIGNTLSPYYQDKKIVIATKGGMKPGSFKIDSSPQNLQLSLENSLNKLKLKRIDLYFLHRVDPNVPLKESILFLKRMQDQGKISYLGLSEVTVSQIDEARKYINVMAVQNQYSLDERKHEEVLNYCEKEKIVFIPWAPLGKGGFEMPPELLQKYNATSTQLVLAWLLQKSSVMLPIPGSTSTKHIEENVNSLKIKLDPEDFEKLSNL